MRRLDEFDQPLTLPLDHVLLEFAELLRVETACAGVRQQHVQIDEIQPGGILNESFRRQAARCDARGRRCHELTTVLNTRQRDLQRGDIRIVDQPLADLGQLVRDQTEGHVQPLEVRIRSPTHEPHQPRRLSSRHRGQVASRH